MDNKVIRVLLIDDMLTDRELIKSALLDESSFQFEITEAKSGKEFYKILAPGKFDVVLSDFNILGFEGIETIEAVNAVDPDLPVIIVTGTGSEEIAVQCLKTGAADYILKTSHDIVRLPHTIASVLDKKKLELEQRKYIAEIAFHSQLIKNVSDAIVSTDKNFIINGWNPSAERLYGWKKEEAIGKNTHELFPSPMSDQEEQDWLGQVKKEGHWQGEILLKHKNGKPLFVESSVAVLRDVDQNFDGFVFVNRDISERKLVDLLLKTRMQLIEYTFNHSLDEVLQKSLDVIEEMTGSKIGFFHFLDENEKMIVLTAWSTHTLQSSCQAVGKDSHYRVDEAGVWVDCVRQRKTVIHNDIASLPNRKGFPEGHAELERELVVPMFRKGKIVAILGIGNKETDYDEKDVKLTKDIADIALTLASNKRMQKKLEISEKNYRTIVENQTELIDCWFPDGTLTFVNDAYCSFYGIRAEEAIGKRWVDIVLSIDEEERDAVLHQILSFLTPSNPFNPSVYSDITHDGNVRWLNWVDKGIFDEKGNLLEVQSVGRDITQIKQAEEALIDSEDKFKYVFDFSIAGKSITSPTGEMHANQAFCDMLGYQKDALEGIQWQSLTHPDDIELTQNEIADLLSGEKQSTRFVKRYIHQDGSVVWTDESTKLRRDSEENPLYFITTILDITEPILQREEIIHRANDMTLLNQATLEMSTHSTFQEICDSAVYFLKQHPDWSNVAIFITKDKGKELEFITSDVPAYHERLREIYKGSRRVLESKSMLELAITRNQTIRCQDYLLTVPYPGVLEKMRSGLFAPFMYKGEELGMICVEHEEANMFNKHSEELVGMFAKIISNFLQKLSLFLHAEKQLKKIETLRAIDQAITTTTDLEVVVEIILDQCIGQLKVDSATILLFDSNVNLLQLMKHKGIIGIPVTDEMTGIKDSVLESVVRNREMIHATDSTSDKSERLVQLSQMGVKDYYALPLVTKGEIKGVLEIYHHSIINPDNEWLAFLKMLSTQAAIAIENANLFKNLQKNNFDLLLAYDETLEGWAKALDMRDSDTEGHTRRVVEISLKLARALGISEGELMQIRRGAMLHDIGKIGIPDDILRKPGKLTEEEWDIMRKHPVYAYNMISPIEYLRPALDIPYCHHERWDGTGYPRGLKEKEIPLSARLFSVADVYEALISDRPYRKAWTKEKALEYIRDESGTYFDPNIVEVFLEMMEKENKG